MGEYNITTNMNRVITPLPLHSKNQLDLTTEGLGLKVYNSLSELSILVQSLQLQFWDRK